MTMKTMHIGLDDTDSPKKGCTTYITALLVEKLERLEVGFVDYPNLVRLNPNVPWKTRGNGALCLRIKCSESGVEEIKDTVTRTVEKHADFEHEGTDPGIVFFESAIIPREVQTFSQDAIAGIVSLKDSLKLLKRFGGEAVGFKKCRGIIGALAAVGEDLQADHTFEILAYRAPENLGSERRVDTSSILEMDRATTPYTFNNVDQETGRILITPRGPDPILLGIRGETAEIVKRAFEIVKPLEPVERWVIFRTNQGTDAHLKRVKQLSQLKPYNPVIASGTVATNPRIIPRRHVIFSIKDESAQVDCAAYEPTGFLRKVARQLIVGDHLEVCGSVRAPSQNCPLTINLEKIRLLRLAPEVVYRNPICPACGKRLTSMGRNKGFRCRKCNSRHRDLRKIKVEMKRELRKSLYMTSPRSQRHLTKPLRRYGLERCQTQIKELIEDWHFP